MKIIVTLGLILTVICVALVFQQLFLLKKEIQRLDDDQVITDEWAKKFSMRLYRIIGLIMLTAILSIAVILLHYLKI